ncbi:hypothetical protein BTVI_83956 [Pitangus sulphuratus]|nr:hypothetical protein BTVI_83956 [Pitangus sulphuratus]
MPDVTLAKMDMTLAKAEPISNTGSTSPLRRGKKKIAAEQQPERRVIICASSSTNVQTPRSVQKEAEEVFKATLDGALSNLV